MQSIDNSLRSLGVDALDLVQFYWHDYGAQKYVPAAQRLAELQEASKIRHIGVTNFDVPRLDEIVQGGVRVVSNQASCSGLCSRNVLMHHVHNVRGVSTKEEWNVACILATSGSPRLLKCWTKSLVRHLWCVQCRCNIHCWTGGLRTI